MQDSAQYEDFPEFPQPTLIFHGCHDDVVPVEYSEEFAATRSNVRLHVLDSGHDLLNVLEEIAEQSLEFLAHEMWIEFEFAHRDLKCRREHGIGRRCQPIFGCLRSPE